MTSKESVAYKFGIFLIPILGIVVRLIPGTRTIDDAYITYRYVLNILDGNGMVFNPGEWVLGTTTPAYTFLLTGLGWLVSRVFVLDLPKLSCLINALLDGIGCYVIILTGKKINKKSIGFLTAGVWAFAPYSVTFAIGGLETSLYVMLLWIIVYFSLTKHRNLTAAFSTLAFLTRPDAAILIFLIILERLSSVKRDSDRIHFMEIVLWTAPILIWMIISGVLYGSPFPHSVQAKMLAYHLNPYDGLIRIMQHIATPFLEEDIFGPAFIPFGLLLYPFLYIVGIRTLYKEAKQTALLMLFPLLYSAVFSAANPLIFRWYLTPPTPFFILVVFIGVQNIIIVIKSSTRPFAHSRLISNGLTVAFMSLPILLSIAGWSIHPTHGSNRPAPEMAWFKLELQYREALKLIQPQIQTTDTIAAADVGVVGYYSGVHILDTVGLNSPESLDYYPLNPECYVMNYAIPTKLILKEKPEWLIFLEVYGRKTLLSEPEFQAHYRQVAKLESDIYGSDGMLIFRLKQAVNTIPD